MSLNNNYGAKESEPATLSVSGESGRLVQEGISVFKSNEFYIQMIDSTTGKGVSALIGPPRLTRFYCVRPTVPGDTLPR